MLLKAPDAAIVAQTTVSARQGKGKMKRASINVKT